MTRSDTTHETACLSRQLLEAITRVGDAARQSHECQQRRTALDKQVTEGGKLRKQAEQLRARASSATADGDAKRLRKEGDTKYAQGSRLRQEAMAEGAAERGRHTVAERELERAKAEAHRILDALLDRAAGRVA